MVVQTNRFLILIGSALLILLVDEAAAQNRSPLPPPSRTLPPVAEQTYFEETADPFIAEAPNNEGLNWFHTRAIPFASWSTSETWPEEIINSTTISRFRKAFYQRSSFGGGWIAKDGDGGLGSSYFNASIATTVGKPSNVVLISPSFEADYLDGPAFIDVPSKLYSTSMTLVWRWEMNERWGTVVSVIPGFYSDFESSDAMGFRLTGLVAISYTVLPDCLNVYGGVVYLDRNDYQLIPAAGLTWTPSADFRVDLIFPKPKIAKRVGHIPYVNEDWLYVSGGFGGGTWDVERTAGGFDELTLSDLRLTVGLERIVEGGTGWYAEIGYIFQRELEYEISGERFDFADSFGIEAGFSF